MQAATENRSRVEVSLRLNVKKITALRKAHGIKSDAEFARLIGVDPVTLYRYLSQDGRPSNIVIARIKKAFPLVSLDELLTLEVAS